MGNNDQKNIYILQSAIPQNLRNIEFAIKSNLERKIDYMGQLLNDTNLIKMALDETEGLMPIDENITLEDIKSMMEDLIKS